MKGVAWSKFWEKIVVDMSVANTVIGIWDEDGLSNQLKINSEWWDYNYNGKIKNF